MTPRPGYEVQVCLRPFTPQDVQQRQQEVIGRIEALAADGIVDPTVVWWSPRVCPPGTDNPLSAGCPDVVHELLDLADRDGFSLEPFIRKVGGVHPGTDDSLVLPVICLVVRHGGAIGGLYPVALDDTKFTVEDGLQALETGGGVLNLA
ncbi:MULTISPECIES: HTH domain-containing protein [Salinibaculum]|uniref:HTH domain-containing protein n=1 Tax=Salinibaculum TaxID=2732368 RepID=UPI0030CB7382